jgi:toxin ParE1/3/4
MELRLHPAAHRELDEAFNWCKAVYGRRVAARLLRRFEAIGKIILREPGVGTPGIGNTRTLPLKTFPYTLVYRVDARVIHVVALMHQSRMPGYWIARVPE